MENSLLKKILPHGIAVALILALAFVFFSPYVFDGKVLQQGDIQKADASQAEIQKYYKETGKPVLWTGAYFSGMPTTQIFQVDNSNLTQPIFRAAFLWQGLTAPHASIWLAMLSMYLLLVVMRVDWRISLIGAVTFGLSSFNMDIIEAGHSTKMAALAFSPLLLAGAVLCLRGKYLLGAAVTGLATAMQVGANHYQMTYYVFIIMLIWGIFELVHAIRQKELAAFGKAVGALVVGVLLGVLCNITSIWTTQTYQSETQRGIPNLSDSKNPKEGGVTKEYATDWSYGVGESLTLLVQNAMGGGASQTHISTKTYEQVSPQILQSMPGVPADKARVNADRQISSLFYTGSQPFVGVSIYYGAVCVFLFITGLFLLEGRKKWWLLTSTLVLIMTAWGKNSPFFDIMYASFPLFNKFRAVTQALGLGQMLFVIMAGLSLQAMFDPSVSTDKKWRALYIGGGITAFLCLIAITFGGGDGKRDAELPQQIVQLLRDDRAALARADAFRSLFLVLASGGLLWAYLAGRLKSAMVVAGIGVLTLFDVWTIAKRILYAEKFDTPQEAKAALEAKPADLKIMQDKDLSYRVLDLRSGDPFQNAQTSMFHKSVGGYHSAKLMIYQEMIAKYLGNFQPNVPILAQPILPLYSMLNTRYIIMGDAETDVQVNPSALGNAWFVKNVKIVDNADQEIQEVGKINPQTEVVMQKAFAEKIKATTLSLQKESFGQYDSTATIKLTSYHPDRLEYESKANTEQLAVFSEIYYPQEKGWTLTIDGQPTDFAKANYILRAAKIPAGSHKIVMAFEPKAYFTGQTIGYIASGLTLLLFAGGLFLYFRKNGFPSVTHLFDMDISKKGTPKTAIRKIGTETTATPKAPIEPAKKKLKPKK
jgi:hypothetical protein